MSYWIKNEIEFNCPLQLSDCFKMSLNYFEQFGFKNAIQDSDSIQLKRGNEILNGFTFVPLKWMSVIKLQFSQVDDQINVKGTFDINTKNQMVSTKEIEAWNSLITNYQELMTTGSVDLAGIFKKNYNSKRSSLLIALLTIFGTLLGGGIGTYLAIESDVLIIIPALTILTSLLFLKISHKFFK